MCVLCAANLMKQETKAWKLGPSGRYSSPLTLMSESRNSLYSIEGAEHREAREEWCGADGLVREMGRKK